MLTHRESVSLSLVRIVSVTFIVGCHFLQAFHSRLDSWFNVGVQVFFCLSGFLFGQKEITDYTEWYKKRLKRILKPYYLYIIITFALFLILLKDSLSIKQIVVYLLSIEGIWGENITRLEHLWFVPNILICYFVVPFIKNHNIAKNKQGEAGFICSVCIQCVILLVLLKVEIASSLATFLIGFYFSSRYKTNIPKYIKVFLFASSVVLLPVTIYMQDIVAVGHSDLHQIIVYEFVMYHVLMGITLFVYLFDLFKSIRAAEIIQHWLSFIDEYSYEIYLTHYFYILGINFFMSVTPIPALNVLIILAVTGISSFVLKKISDIPFSLFQKTVTNKRRLTRPGAPPRYNIEPLGKWGIMIFYRFTVLRSITQLAS